MKNMKSSARKAATVFAVAMFAFAAGAADAPAPAEAEPAAEKPAPAKKKPKKAGEYTHWKQAEEVAMAWNQPIVALYGINGDKAVSKLRMATFGLPSFKEFSDANFVFYNCKIPEEVKKGHRGRPVPKAKDAPLKPDLTQLKQEDRVALDKAIGNNRSPAFPMIAVYTPDGKFTDCMPLTVEDASIARLMEVLRPMFEKGKWPLEVTKKFQKAMDDEAKKQAALEKRMKK